MFQYIQKYPRLNSSVFSNTFPTLTINGTKWYKLLNTKTKTWYFIHSVSLIWCSEIQCQNFSRTLPWFFPLVQNWSKQMCAQMKTRCPPHSPSIKWLLIKMKNKKKKKNGAKLKKETQCPWTYKNKLILCVSSHCQPFFSGPKDSHTQTEASLAFLHTNTANHNHLCTPTANEKRSMYT